MHFKDPFSDDERLVNPVEVRAKYEAEARAQINVLRKELNKTRSSLLELETDKEFTMEIFKFFRLRQKFKK